MPIADTALTEHLLSQYGERPIPLYDFVQSALYTPQIGYYSDPDKARVGKSTQNDFYTSSTLGIPFYRMVEAAAKTLAGNEFCTRATFIEIGSEPSNPDFQPKAFRAHRNIPLGSSIDLEGECVVFSNELFDAQAFDQMVFSSGGWQFSAARWNGESWERCLLQPEKCERPLPGNLPQASGEGYVIDVPTGAEALLREISEQSWTGLFLAFDYGKDWVDMTLNHPEGTARAYKQHRQHNNILLNPGTQDITHHVCWDRLENILLSQGFSTIETQRQEAFFMTNASDTISQMIEGSLEARRTLMELLHPAHLGTKFQVLRAQRGLYE